MATRSLTDEFSQLRAEKRMRRDPSEPRAHKGSGAGKSLLEEVELGSMQANPLSVRSAVCVRPRMLGASDCRRCCLLVIMGSGGGLWWWWWRRQSPSDKRAGYSRFKFYMLCCRDCHGKRASKGAPPLAPRARTCDVALVIIPLCVCSLGRPLLSRAPLRSLRRSTNHTGLLGARSQSPTVVKNMLPPAWVDTVEQVRKKAA
jgi:hypothetical protein